MSFGPTSSGELDSSSYFHPEHPPGLAPIRKKVACKVRPSASQESLKTCAALSVSTTEGSSFSFSIIYGPEKNRFNCQY